MTKKLIIFGGGGFAREVAWLVADINRSLQKDFWDIVGFVEHSNERVGQFMNGLPIVNILDLKVANETYAVVAIGTPSIRERAVDQARELGLKFATLIHPDVQMDKNTVEIGEGSILCSGNTLTVNIAIGKHVIVNLDCTIGHDCVLEDFVTVSPGCHLSGYTTIGYGAYLGTGAVSVEKHHIGARSIIGAGGVVVKDIPVIGK